MIEFISTSEFSTNEYFKNDIGGIRIGTMARKDQKEIDKFISLIILCCFNSSSADLNEQIESLPKDLSNEFLAIIEKYIVIDEAERYSCRPSIQKLYTARDTTMEKEDKEDKDDIYQRTSSQKENDAYIDSLVAENKKLKEEIIKLSTNEMTIERLQNENNSLNEKITNFEIKIKDYERQLKVYKIENERCKSKVDSMNKEYRKVEEMKLQIKELTDKLEEKEKEKSKLKLDIKQMEDKHQNTVDQLNAKLEGVKENEINNRDLIKDYEKLKSNYQKLQEVRNKYETLKKDYRELKKYLESKDKSGALPLTVSEKEKMKKFEDIIKEKESIIERKDKQIQELNTQIQSLKENKGSSDFFETKQIPQKETQPFIGGKNYEFDSEMELFKDRDSNEERGRSPDDEKLIMELNQKLKDITEELDNCKQERDSINERCKKENDVLKNQLQKEFELISSAMYNLGVNFWNMKFEYEQKLNSNASWLVREREKSLNGDN